MPVTKSAAPSRPASTSTGPSASASAPKKKGGGVKKAAAVAGSVAAPEAAPFLLGGAAASGGGDTKTKVKLGSGSKVLLAEFLVCFVVLGLGTVVAPSGSKDGVPRLMSRGTGLCLLFFILGLVSGTGPGSKKAAEGLGGLVTVAYLVTSSDAHDLVTWISGYYSKQGVAARVGSGLTDAGTAASAAGAVGEGLASAGSSAASTIGQGIGDLGSAAGE